MAVVLGFIGIGIMGRSMCRHLLEKGGASVVIYSRTKDEKVEQLLQHPRCSWADSPREVASRASIVFTMLGLPRDVEHVYFDDITGIFASALTGVILVDHSTSSPSLAARIAETAAALGIEAVDAPVSGGDVVARAGTLSIFAGASRASTVTAEPLAGFLRAMGTATYMGLPGSGQHAKMANQVIIASTMVGVCEALLYATRAGLDPSLVVRALQPGAAGCWSLTNLAPRILASDWSPGFKVTHFIKDLGIALAEARQMGLATPGLALAHQLYVATEAGGGGECGTQAMYRALERLSGPGAAAPK